MSRADHPLKLRDRVRQVIRTRRYSRRTEKSYWYWIRTFIRFHGMRHPSDLGAEDVRAFLTWLAVRRNVAASTQNQALNALVFLYDKVLEQPLGNIGSAVRAKRPPRLPVVLEHAEAMAIITALKMPYRLVVSLMYGAGLRVSEATRLRVKDVDVSRQILTVRNGKGGKDRSTLLPQTLRSTLQERIATIRQSVREQSAADQTPVSLPFALDRKYPGAGTSTAWQWLFPSANLCCDDLGRVVRHHVHTSSVQKAVKAATAPGASPAACPSASLTHLKSSRSIWATVREAPGRVDRAIS